MKLKSYLTLTTIATTSSIVIIVSIAILYLLQSSYQKALEDRGLELARVIAHDPRVIRAVQAQNLGHPPIQLQHYIEAIRSRTDASYIVIVDKHAIRLTHPNINQIGQHFIGDDIQPILKNGIEYSTTAPGSLGMAIRNFAPIYLNKQLIGAICIGYLSEKDISYHFSTARSYRITHCPRLSAGYQYNCRLFMENETNILRL
ncbi:hypothetical protein P4S72_26115 [Vibrio sp. PP-XX7]